MYILKHKKQRLYVVEKEYRYLVHSEKLADATKWTYENAKKVQKYLSDLRVEVELLEVVE